MEPLRLFYAEERKVLLMFRINLQPARPAWYAPAAVACFVLAVIAGLGGGLLTTSAIVNAHNHPTLYAVGITSLILSLPIAILGAHWLDLLDQQRKRSDSL